MAKTQIATSAAASAQSNDPGEFANLLDQRFKPKGEEQREAVVAAVRTLAEQALSNTVTMSDDAYSSIANIIAEIDNKLTSQINLILHHADFQKMEAA